MKPGRTRKRERQVGFRDRLEYAALRVVAALLRALPLEVASALMGWLWRIFAPFTSRHRRVLRNLGRAFPEMAETERRRIASRQWENLGRVFAETFQIDRIAADPNRIDFIISPELMQKAMEHEGGISFVSAHLANWEVVALPARHYRRTAGLYQHLSNPLSDAYVVELRKEVFPGGLFTKGVRTAGHIMQWVRQGNAVAMLGDTRERKGIWLSFFGMPMKANPFPAMVARRLGVPLIAGTTRRLPGARFQVEAIEIPVPVTDDPAADAALATQAALDHFEAKIRERPEDWMWVLNVWRGNPQRRTPQEPDIVAPANRT